jgi:hypothetical protein
VTKKMFLKKQHRELNIKEKIFPVEGMLPAKALRRKGAFAPWFQRTAWRHFGWNKLSTRR